MNYKVKRIFELSSNPNAPDLIFRYLSDARIKVVFSHDVDEEVCGIGKTLEEACENFYDDISGKIIRIYRVNLLTKKIEILNFLFWD